MKIPEIEEPRQHWKVGDSLDLGETKFVIAQMCLVLCEDDTYELNYYDETGALRGSETFEAGAEPVPLDLSV